MHIFPIQQNINNTYKQKVTHTNFKSKPVVKNNKIVNRILNYSLIFSVIATAGVYFNTIHTKLKQESTYIEPTQTHFDTKESAINYAISQITPYLNQNLPVEYSVLIAQNSNNYKIESECVGDSHSVLNYDASLAVLELIGIDQPYISLHGHPENRDKSHTQTFSFEDFKVFNSRENCIEDYVVNKYGQICCFKKNENFKKISDEELNNIEIDFEEAYYYAWPNKINIFDENNNLIKSFNDKQGMHQFWANIAKKYNLEYSTTFGEFNGYDAYKNGYYPNDKIVPESFKK